MQYEGDDYRAENASAAGGIVFNDPNEGDILRQSLQFLVKRVSNQVVSGNLNVTSLSMPVHFNEPRSLLERITDDWAYAPHYLTAAAATTDPVQRLKLVATFVVSGLHCINTLGKPFNPILGSTYQAKLSDGTMCYVEQTSHHPPVTHYYLRPTTPSYTLAGFSGITGSIEWGLDPGLSSRRTGVNVVEFQDGSRIVYNLPRMLLKGLSSEKKCEFLGPFSLFYEQHSLVFDILINPPQPQRWSPFRTAVPTDYLDGVLYKLESECTLRLAPLAFTGAFARAEHAFFGNPDAVNAQCAESGTIPIELRRLADVALSVTSAIQERDNKRAARPAYANRTVISYARGTFVGYFDIDGERYWDIRTTPKGSVIAEDLDAVLQSDCRFREDVHALRSAIECDDELRKADGLAEAQTLKEKLENIQRNDRKLRAEGVLDTDEGDEENADRRDGIEYSNGGSDEIEKTTQGDEELDDDEAEENDGEGKLESASKDTKELGKRERLGNEEGAIASSSSSKIGAENNVERITFIPKALNVW